MINLSQKEIQQQRQQYRKFYPDATDQQIDHTIQGDRYINSVNSANSKVNNITSLNYRARGSSIWTNANLIQEQYSQMVLQKPNPLKKQQNENVQWNSFQTQNPVVKQEEKAPLTKQDKGKGPARQPEQTVDVNYQSLKDMENLLVRQKIADIEDAIEQVKLKVKSAQKFLNFQSTKKPEEFDRMLNDRLGAVLALFKVYNFDITKYQAGENQKKSDPMYYDSD